MKTITIRELSLNLYASIRRLPVTVTKNGKAIFQIIPINAPTLEIKPRPKKQNPVNLEAKKVATTPEKSIYKPKSENIRKKQKEGIIRAKEEIEEKLSKIKKVATSNNRFGRDLCTSCGFKPADWYHGSNKLCQFCLKQLKSSESVNYKPL